MAFKIGSTTVINNSKQLTSDVGGLLTYTYRDSDNNLVVDKHQDPIEPGSGSSWGLWVGDAMQHYQHYNGSASGQLDTSSTTYNWIRLGSSSAPYNRIRIIVHEWYIDGGDTTYSRDDDNFMIMRFSQTSLSSSSPIPVTTGGSAGPSSTPLFYEEQHLNRGSFNVNGRTTSSYIRSGPNVTSGASPGDSRPGISGTLDITYNNNSNYPTTIRWLHTIQSIGTQGGFDSAERIFSIQDTQACLNNTTGRNSMNWLGFRALNQGTSHLVADAYYYF